MPRDMAGRHSRGQMGALEVKKVDRYYVIDIN